MWYFRPKVEGETIREPVQSEFFATDAISGPGMALVREGIQNSLDAGIPGKAVLVRIYLSGDEKALAASQIAAYLQGAWEHIRAKGNGLLPDELPTERDPCPYLAFEDFGTRGLEGCPAEAFRSPTGQKNHFYHFFRAEGQSDKDASQRGSWGVGKHVFLRSSRISGLLALTVRAEDNQALMLGKMVLKSHYVGNKYCQDGYFGVPPPQDRHLVMPIADRPELARFCRLFDLQRGADSGLSLVVPWPDRDITDESLTRAVLRDYFYPILSGQLEVIVETPTVKTVLDRNSLLAEVGRIGELAEDVKPLVELAHWAGQLPSDQRHELNMPPSDRAWQWCEELFPKEVLASLRAAFRSGDRIAIRVPVAVRRKEADPERSFMDVLMVRDEGEQAGRPTFIREGVIVPKVDAPRTRGVRALVTIHDLPLAAFLRDAENPSHTEWQHDGSNFRGKYRSGRSDLTFVKRSISEIVRILYATERVEDPTALVDFFSLPARPDEEETIPTRRKRPPEPPPPPPPAARFRIHRMKGGFSVVSGDVGSTPPGGLDIRVGYDVRRGSALKRYRSADFRVDRSPIRLDPPPKGIKILLCTDNRILAEILEPMFSLHVTGFDERRDLYVRAVPLESAHGDSTT